MKVCAVRLWWIFFQNDGLAAAGTGNGTPPKLVLVDFSGKV